MKIPFLRRSQRSPEDAYEKMVTNIMMLVIKKTMASEKGFNLLPRYVRFRVLPEVVLGGCVMAANAWTNLEPLKQHWLDASDREKRAVGEACTLEVMAYVFGDLGNPHQPQSVVARFAARVDDLFAHSFPNATDFARSLYKQRLSDNTDAASPSPASWATVIALQGVVSAAGLSQLPMRPLPMRFPVHDSASLVEAGVPLPFWGDIIEDQLVYHTLLVDASARAIKGL